VKGNDICDGFGNSWSRCKLGADCGLKVIEAGKARCWCQDQEASRDKVQSAREEIAKLEAENAALREDKARLDWLERRSVSRLDWVITIFETNKIAVREAIDAARKETEP